MKAKPRLIKKLCFSRFLGLRVTPLCVFIGSILSSWTQGFTQTPIDSDMTWGRGGQLSLINPSLITPPYSSLGLSYDLFSALESPDQINEQFKSVSEWGHSLNLSARLSQSYTIGVGYLKLPSRSIALQDHITKSSVLNLSQSFMMSDRLNIGLSLSRHNDEWLPLYGLSYGIAPWLTSAITLRGFSHDMITAGKMSLGLGLKPISGVVVGLNATPYRGGGSLGANAQLSLWKGLALELGWQSARGGAELSQTMTDLYRHAHTLSQEGEHLFRLGLSWRGQSGWRVESGVNALSSTQLGIRLQSTSDPSFEITPHKRLIVINARDQRELSYENKLFGSSVARFPHYDLLKTLDKLSEEDDVEAVTLVLGGGLGLAQAEEMIDLILKLRLHGTLVYAYLPQAHLTSYLVAASCDVIWASPTAELSISGLLRERFYVKGMLDKLKITPEVLTVGEYKSAPEIFVREGPSEEAQEVDKRLLDARFGAVIELLTHRSQQQRWASEPSPSLTRGKRLISLKKRRDREPSSPEDRARAITWINEGPYSAQNALKSGLVDKIVSPSELEKRLRDAHPYALMSSPDQKLNAAEWAPLPEIAVIHAIGEIGASGPFSTSADPVISAPQYLPLIKRATYDSSIRAVVLRVDSPGGAVTDADALWVALKELAERKPLVVSMGNTAASGGYYIAAPAHMIFASSHTLTGSIGVFAGKVDLSSALEEFGINIHRESRGNTISRSLFTPWSDQAKKRLTTELERVYELFLDRIMVGRPHLTKERLIPLAGGRVWTGDEAKERGLVDMRGGLLDAIKWATVKAGLAERPHTIRSLSPEQSSSLRRLIGFMSLDVSTLASPLEPLHSVRSSSSKDPVWLVILNTALKTLPSSIRFSLSMLATSPQTVLALDPRW